MIDFILNWVPSGEESLVSGSHFEGDVVAAVMSPRGRHAWLQAKQAPIKPAEDGGSVIDEVLAAIRQIDAKLDRLLGPHGGDRPTVPARPGRGGRRVETDDVGSFVDQLKRDGLTWKEVVTQCKKRWPDDARVGTADQLRKTLERYRRRLSSSD